MSSRSIGILMIALTSIPFFIGCGGDDRSDSSGLNPSSDSSVKYVDSIYKLTDTFTQIKRQLCNNDSDSLVDYTNENSSYIPFYILDPTAIFIYMSNVDCGLAGGTCGDYISIINRKSNDVYHQKIQVCGVLDSVDFSIMKLFYSTSSDGKQYAIDLSKEMPTVEYIGVNNIPVIEIETMADSMGVLSENLVFGKGSIENPDAINVDMQNVVLQDGLTLVVYKLNLSGIPYAFTFLRASNLTVPRHFIGGVGQITVDYQGGELGITYNSGHENVRYIVNKIKKSFVKK